jgi:hypothetical protein
VKPLDLPGGGPEDRGPLVSGGLIFVLGLIYVASITVGAFRCRPYHGKAAIMSIKIRKVEDLKATSCHIDWGGQLGPLIVCTS